MGTSFITHITGKCTDGGGSVRERLHLLPSERLIIKGPRQRQHGSSLQKPTCGLERRYISAYVQQAKVKKQHRTRIYSQKKIRRELQSIPIPKTIHIPSGQELSSQSSS